MFFPNRNQPVNNDRLYNILGIDKKASDNEIKKAYRKLALKHHPDKGGDSEKFKEITEANETLSNEEKRKIYDQFGEEGLKPEFQNTQSFNPEDIFGQFFPQQRTQFVDPNKGKDIVHPLELSLEEIYTGITKKMAINRDIICPECLGIGCDNKNKIIICKGCNGNKVKIHMREIGPGMIQQLRSKCNDCNGEGKIIPSDCKCKKCKGKKVIKEKLIKEIKIERGINPDETIIFKGQSDEYPGKKTGDIIFVIKEKRHPTFKRKGSNLLITQEIGLNEALCGFKFKLRHLDGRELYIESNSDDIINSNEFKAVQGLGMPIYNSDKFGHLAILFKVKFPEELSKTQKKILVSLFNYKYPETKKEDTVKICNVNDVDFNEPVNKMRYTTEERESYKCNIM